jgi:hypothetical protein
MSVKAKCPYCKIRWCYELGKRFDNCNAVGFAPVVCEVCKRRFFIGYALRVFTEDRADEVTEVGIENGEIVRCYNGGYES